MFQCQYVLLFHEETKELLNYIYCMQYACIRDFTSTKYHLTSLLSLNISSHPKCLPSAMLLLAMSVVPSLLTGVSERLLQTLLLGMLSHQANNPLALKGRIEIKK